MPLGEVADLEALTFILAPLPRESLRVVVLFYLLSPVFGCPVFCMPLPREGIRAGAGDNFTENFIK